MKKLFTFFLVFVLILSSCSKGGISEIPIPENTGSSSEESPETSSSPEESEEINYAFLPKGVAGSSYCVIDEFFPDDGEFGTEADLKRWKTEASDTENIYKFVVYNAECEDRYLSKEEVYALVSELQSLFPEVYEQPENPATGGAISVAAYGFDGEIKWIMSWGGFFTVYFPENENALYFNGNNLYFDSLMKIVDYRSPLSHP